MTPKKFLIILAVAGPAACLSLATAAQCSPGKPVANVNNWQNLGAGSGLGTTLYGGFWQVGSGASANSGTIAQNNTLATPYSTGYYVTTNWGNTGVVGCPCPGGNCGTSRTAFLYSRANSGTGQFLVMSVAWSAGLSRYPFDAVTVATPTPIAIPQPTPVTYTGGTSTYTATVKWSPLSAAQLKGYYDVDPGQNIITGYTIRYLDTAGGAPGSYATGSWTACTTGSNVNIGLAGTDPGATGVTVTFPAPAAGHRVYLAMSVLFDGASAGDSVRETKFVGAPSIYFGPTAAPVFNGVTADTTSVSWTSGVETRVASYQVYWAPNLTDTFKPVGTSVAARGDNQSYTTNYRVLTTAQSYYVKVRASKTDGTFEYSTPILVRKDVKGGGTLSPNRIK